MVLRLCQGIPHSPKASVPGAVTMALGSEPIAQAGRRKQRKTAQPFLPPDTLDSSRRAIRGRNISSARDTAK